MLIDNGQIDEFRIKMIYLLSAQFRIYQIYMIAQNDSN